jgi:hypothetical protein
MNNDLEQLSEEYLKELINSPADELTIALARIALAAKQAKPVGYLENGKGFMYEPRHKDLIKNPTPVYTTPQLAHTEVNSPEIPDGWKLVPEEATLAMLTLLGVTGSFSSMQQKYQNMLDAAPMHDACLTNEDSKSDGWIKCSDRLPDDESFVLVTNGKHTGMGAYLRDEHLEDDERWQDEHFEFINKQSKYPVTHWMPLPPNPEE